MVPRRPMSPPMAAPSPPGAGSEDGDETSELSADSKSGSKVTDCFQFRLRKDCGSWSEAETGLRTGSGLAPAECQFAPQNASFSIPIWSN